MSEFPLFPTHPALAPHPCPVPEGSTVWRGGRVQVDKEGVGEREKGRREEHKEGLGGDHCEFILDPLASLYLYCFP